MGEEVVVGRRFDPALGRRASFLEGLDEHAFDDGAPEVGDRPAAGF
jgi:hypothetical protein